MASVLAFDTTIIFKNRLGAVNNAGVLNTIAGGTQTPLATYSDAALTIPNATSLTLTSGGKLTTNVYISDSVYYRFVMLTSGGVPVFVTDQVFPNKFNINALGDVTAISNLPVSLSAGTGSPESVLTANAGSIFLSTTGGIGNTLFVKETGTGNTGWARTPSIQPKLTVTNLATITNVTGDATVYQAVFETTLENVGVSYNSGTGAATIPSDGFYSIDIRVGLSDIGISHTMAYASIKINTTDYYIFKLNPGAVKDSANQFIGNGTISLSLLEEDTVACAIMASGGGKTIDFLQDSTLSLYKIS